MISGPLPEQSVPPNWGAGLVQFLVFFMVPPPQVTLQDVHGDHSVYPPFTVKYRLTVISDKVQCKILNSPISVTDFLAF